MIRWLTFTCAFLAWIADASAGHVQGVVSTYTDSTGQASWSATLPATVLSGDCVVLGIVWDEDTGSTSNLSTITDDKGNSYTVLDTSTNGGSRFFESAFLSNITNSPQTITATMSGDTAQGTQIVVDEYTPCSVDGHSAMNAQTTTPTSGNFTTSNSNDIIWGADLNSSGVASSESAGSGFTALEQDTGAGTWNLMSEQKSVVAPGVNAATFTRSSNYFGETVGVGLSFATVNTCQSSLLLRSVGC